MIAVVILILIFKIELPVEVYGNLLGYSVYLCLCMNFT